MNPYLLYQKSCVVKPVSVKNSVIEQHLRLAKHGTVKNQVSKKNKDKKISDMLQKYDQEKRQVGEILSDEVKVFRIKVV